MGCGVGDLEKEKTQKCVHLQAQHCYSSEFIHQK